MFTRLWSSEDWIVQCFTSPPTQYRLYGRRFFTRQKTQPTVSKYWRRNATKEKNTNNTKNTPHTETWNSLAVIIVWVYKLAQKMNGLWCVGCWTIDMDWHWCLLFFFWASWQFQNHNRKSRFLPARRYASAGYRDRNVSVRLSCAGIVSKRRKLAAWFLHHLVAPRL